MAILPSLALLIVGMLMDRKMAILFSLALLVGGVLAVIGPAVPAVPRLRCTKDGNDYKIKITATKDATHAAISSYASETDLTTTTCKTDTVNAGNNLLELPELTVDANRDQTNPPIATTNCQIEAPAAPDTGKVYIRVMGRALPGVVQFSDKFYLFKLDLATQCNGVEFAADDNKITATVTQDEQTPEVDSITAKLIDASSGDDLSTDGAGLDATVKLEVTYNRPADAAHPLGIFIHDLYAANNKDLENAATKKVKMSDANGCKVNPTTDGLFQLSAQFVPTDTALDRATATKFVTKSGDFKLALFEQSGMNIILVFKYQASCFTTADKQCFDLAGHCGGKRRRRSATQPSLNGTATLEVRVRLGNGGDTASQGGNDRNTPEECKTARDFWVVAIVLGCLLLAVLLFAVFLFYRLKSEQRRTDKIYQKFGAQNPAF